MNLAERYPPTPELAQAYSEHAPVMTMIPWFSRGMKYAEKSLAIRTGAGDVWGRGQSLHFQGVVLYAASRYRECIEKCREAVTLLDRTGDCWEANTAKWHIAFSLYRLGDLDGASEAAREVRRAAVAIGDHQASGIALGAWSKAAPGDVPADLLQAELERSSEDVHTHAEVLQAEAVRLLGVGQPSEAVAVLRRAERLVTDKGLKQEYVAPVLPWLVTALRAEAEAAPAWSPRRAEALAEARRNARRAAGLSRSYRNNHPHVLRERGLLAAIDGHPRRAGHFFDRSLKVAERQDARHEHAQSLLARSLLGLELDWPGAADQAEAARDALAALAARPAPAEAGAATDVAATDVTLSLLDRFDSLLSVGQRISSALTPPAVYAAVHDAALTLLRAEACTVLALVRTEPIEARIVAGGTRLRYSQDLVATALATGGPAVVERPPGSDGDDPGGPGLADGDAARSTLCAPIFNRSRAVACFYLTHERVGAIFGEDEMRLAEFIATLAGSALENAAGFAEVEALTRSLEKRVDERTAALAAANHQVLQGSLAVDLLRTVAVATNDATTVEGALQVAIEEVCRHIGWPVGHVSLLRRGGTEVVPTDIWHVADHERFGAFRRVVAATRLPVGTGLAGRVAANRSSQWVQDMTSEVQLRGAALAPGLGVRTGFAVPAPLGDRSVAVLEFYSPDTVGGDHAMVDLVAEVGIELGRVAERKRAEDALRRNEERTRSILAAATDAFVGMDQAGLVTDWNRSAEVILGWSSEEAVGRSLASIIIPAASRQAHEEGLARFLVTGEGPLLGRRVETVAQHRDGHAFPIELSIWPTGERTTLSFNAFVQDITERKQTESALAEARDQAMEASRMKSQFLATMSHEIRTPMNGVIGLASLLLDTDLGAHQRPYAEGLRTAGEALLDVIDDILDFSKIEAGRLELEDVAFDTRHLVEEVVGLVAERAHAKGLEIVGACSPALPARLQGDPGRLRQILANLASNAVKFTESGEVVVRARIAPAGPATVCFEVTDTGIGIDAADQRRILEPFSQADASTTRRYGGTGLGLAISSQLAEAMGGAITVDSRLGVGSTFRVSVPLGPTPEVPSERDGGPDDPTSLAGIRTLVVDDNETSRSVLHALLQAWGMCPDAVADGESALARLQAAVAEGRAYEVVVIDAAMPGMDGLELAGRIARDLHLQPIRSVLLTTRLTVDHAGPWPGVDASVAKPVRELELRDRVVSVLTSAPATPAVASAPPAPTARRDLGRVLVVEDNPTNQLVARGLLTKIGYRPDVVSNGAQALAAIEGADYAVVLMDCNMPVMDGYETTQAIRRQEGHSRRLPIIAMTAGALVGDRERCLAVGMDDYVPKPVKLGDLERALSRWSVSRAAAPAPVLDVGDAVDAGQLDALRALDGGDGAFLSGLVESFLASAHEALLVLAEAVRTHDHLALGQAAHRFRGEAATLGATALAGLCREIESLDAPVDQAATTALLAEADSELERVRAALLAAAPRTSPAG